MNGGTSFVTIAPAAITAPSLKIFRQKKPYSPGMITGLIMMALSIWEMVYAAQNNLVTGWQWPVGILIMVVSFILGMIWMLSHTDMKLPDMMKRMQQFQKTGKVEV